VRSSRARSRVDFWKSLSSNEVIACRIPPGSANTRERTGVIPVRLSRPQGRLHPLTMFTQRRAADRRCRERWGLPEKTRQTDAHVEIDHWSARLDYGPVRAVTGHDGMTAQVADPRRSALLGGGTFCAKSSRHVDGRPANLRARRILLEDRAAQGSLDGHASIRSAARAPPVAELPVLEGSLRRTSRLRTHAGHRQKSPTTISSSRDEA